MTDKELTTFANIVEKYGMNIEKLKAAFPNRNICTNWVARKFRKEIEQNPDHKYAHLYKSFLFRTHAKWTPEEE